jgi:polysaccharide chain length determinant protein (PEP-CTERM system associated)
MSLAADLTLDDYIHIIKRRFPFVIGFFFLVFLLATAYAIKLPPVYQSTGTILIESQQVQSDLTKEKYAADRFAALKQVVLNNDNLVKIAEKYKLYGLDKNPNLSRAGLVAATLSNIKVDPLKADAEQWGDKPTFAFKITFKHYKADDTYNITNDLVKLFLEENDRASKAKVTETADFFGKEAEKRKSALEKIENEITSYKESHSNSLPENKGMQVTSLERLENDLRENQREYSATQAELRSLDISIESAKAGVGLNMPQGQSSGPSDLERLKLDLANQSAIYNDDHPSIRALKRKIEALEKNSTSAGSTSGKPATAQSFMVAKLQAQIDTANARLKSLENEESSIRSKINQTEGRVLQSSQTEGVLGTLLRDYDAAKAAYTEIKVKQDNSKIEKNIEMENKGERFVLIEAPLLPERPIKPNRLLIIFAGFFGAIASAIALAVLMEALDKRVRGVESLAAIMKLQPLTAIPYIYTEAELERNKNIVSYTLLSILTIIVVLLSLVHLFIMPLNILTTQILARF